MMSSYTVKQNQIYTEDFRAVMPSLPRLEATKYIREPDAGYFAVWRFSDALMAKAADFNRQINDIIPGFRFDETNLHTTITVYKSQPQDHFKPDNNILKTFATICKNLDSDLLRAVQIDFKEWLFNEGAVIAAGQGNEAFWQIGAEFQAAGARLGHHWRMPWGAHMTVSRFLSDSNKTGDLLTLIKQVPAIGLCQPKAVIVGHFKCGPSNLYLTPIYRREIGE
jgi:hypothetical protein